MIKSRRITEVDQHDDDIFNGSDISLASFKVHDDLNREFWDYQNKLYPQFRQRLLSIAEDFLQGLSLDELTSANPSALVKDVVFVGSLASFNYSSYSDVDLHILFDMDGLTNDPKTKELFKKYFNQARMQWNADHTGLTVKGYDVEIYVQDVKEENAANGVYSLFKDDWIKFPKSMSEMKFDDSIVKAKAKKYMAQIDYLRELLDQGDADPKRIGEVAQLLKDKIIKSRRHSLAIPGSNEMTEPNIIFKVLRRTDHIGKLNDLINKSYDNMKKLTETNKFPPVTMRDVPKDLARGIEKEFHGTIEDNGPMKLPYIYVTIPIDRENPELILRKSGATGRKPRAVVPNFNNARKHQFAKMVQDAGWYVVDQLPPDDAEPDYSMLISPYKNPHDSFSDELDADVLKQRQRDAEQQAQWGKHDDEFVDDFLVEDDVSYIVI